MYICLCVYVCVSVCRICLYWEIPGGRNRASCYELTNLVSLWGSLPFWLIYWIFQVKCFSFETMSETSIFWQMSNSCIERCVFEVVSTVLVVLVQSYKCISLVFHSLVQLFTRQFSCSANCSAIVTKWQGCREDITHLTPTPFSVGINPSGASLSQKSIHLSFNWLTYAHGCSHRLLIFMDRSACTNLLTSYA